MMGRAGQGGGWGKKAILLLTLAGLAGISYFSIKVVMRLQDQMVVMAVGNLIERLVQPAQEAVVWHQETAFTLPDSTAELGHDLPGGVTLHEGGVLRLVFDQRFPPALEGYALRFTPAPKANAAGCPDGLAWTCRLEKVAGFTDWALLPEGCRQEQG